MNSSTAFMNVASILRCPKVPPDGCLERARTEHSVRRDECARKTTMSCLRYSLIMPFRMATIEGACDQVTAGLGAASRCARPSSMFEEWCGRIAVRRLFDAICCTSLVVFRRRGRE